MLLTSEQIKKLEDWTASNGIRLAIKQSPAGSWGSITSSPMMQKVYNLMIVNSVDGMHAYTDAQGVRHITKHHDPRKTLAHEYTHILQVKAGHYIRGDYNTCKNYNEIIANTIGMLLYPSESNIIDNAGYINNYINKRGVKSMMKNLENDIDELYPQVESFLQSLGIL
jgi:Zn-dependent peptidase ImmA (M78 family)